jgi:hypothetical protein
MMRALAWGICRKRYRDVDRLIATSRMAAHLSVTCTSLSSFLHPGYLRVSLASPTLPLIRGPNLALCTVPVWYHLQPGLFFT